MKNDGADRRYTDVDVICQFSADGHIMPIKIRTQDEEGEYQTFVIKQFKQVSLSTSETQHDGIYTSTDSIVFDCCITVFNVKRIIRLYFDKRYAVWHMTT
ncbi:MAG: hypothetical protein K6A69_07560 [Lachnospiraceae bacterium]|nr:hypothetical protein [Lachnospiraceae bacterium]